MIRPELTVTYHAGRPRAAYLRLTTSADRRSHETRRVEPGMVIDFGRDGQPRGLEITAPGAITLEAVNAVLRDLGLPPITAADLAPLVAA